MARHIFLTGEEQIGKSTLLKKVLDNYAGEISGFFTVRTSAFLQNGYSVHLFCTGEPAIPDESNLLVVCGKADDRTRERFDALGCAALAKCSARSLLVMDELGPHEAEAALFRQAVLNLLDGDIPILGVLQAPAERFWPEITHHPYVRMMEVTQKERAHKDIIDHIFTLLQQ